MFSEEGKKFQIQEKKAFLSLSSSKINVFLRFCCYVRYLGISSINTLSVAYTYVLITYLLLVAGNAGRNDHCYSNWHFTIFRYQERSHYSDKGGGVENSYFFVILKKEFLKLQFQATVLKNKY